MNALFFVFQKVFPFWFPSPEQAEEREKARMRAVLVAMYSLDLERIVFPNLREIQEMLSENRQRMTRQDLVDTIERCVRKGYVQKLGHTNCRYVLTPDGRNWLGISGDADE